MIDLDSLAHDAIDLEPLPASVLRLLDILSRNDWSVEAVVETASLDAALTARIMRVANSAAISSAAPVTTLEESTMRLGATTVVKLATGMAVRSHMASTNASTDDSGEEVLWRQSVATAMAADMIANLSPVKIPQEAFTVALLNDIGRIILSRYLDKSTLSLLDRAVIDGRQSPLDAEREILGVDHAELGALIADRWQLPDLIANSIRFHHTPTQAATRDVATLCHVITVADAVATRIVADEEDTGRHFEYADSCAHLNIDESVFEDLCSVVGDQLDSTLADYR